MNFRRAGGALAVVLVSATPAMALINPDALIIRAESGGNPTAQSATSTASGLYGDINSTWAHALNLCGCGSVSQYPTASSAPASIQIAANHALINADGLRDWLCAGCDQNVAAAVAAAGGIGAYQTTGLSANPLDFASADTGGNYFGNGGAVTGVVDGAIIVSNTPSALSTPYSWEWSQMVTSVQNQVSGMLLGTQRLTAQYLTPLLTLSVMVLAFRLMVGRAQYHSIMTLMVRIAVIIPAVAVGSAFYDQYVVQPVMQLPTWWQQFYGQGGTTPVSVFDGAYNAISAAANAMAQSASAWHPAHALWIFIVGGTAWILASVGLWLMFLWTAGTVTLSYIVVILGPIAISMALFNITRQIFWNWCNVLGGLMLTLLASQILLAVYVVNIHNMFNALTLSGTPDTDAPGVVAVGMMIFVLGGTFVAIAAVCAHIARGVAVSGTEMASRWLSGMAARDVALGAAPGQLGALARRAV